MPKDKMAIGETFQIQLIDKDGKVKDERKLYTKTKVEQINKLEPEDEDAQSKPV